MTRLRCASVGIVRLQAFVLLAAGGSAATTAGVFAQQAEIARQLSRTSVSEIMQALVASGLSRAEARTRLNQLGYDPYLADPYFDALDRGMTAGSLENLDASALQAFRGIGVLDDGDATSLEILRPPLADSLGALASAGPQVFGRRVFRQSTSRFEPVLTGPVGDDYVLGPGDRITLIVTGNVELVRERMLVSREGFLVVPDVGQVAVVGLTVEELREHLFTRLRRVYSGIRRGPDANTFFSVSIAGLRTIQVRVLGEVVRPGSYQLSSVATVLEALYFAGGPTDQGTYRRVMLQRGREAPVEVDLYPYLTSGSLSEDHRLQSGDVVFVPEVGRQATVMGEVRRAAIFELAQGEGMKDLLQFAGGLLPSASTHRAGVERILPSADRTPGADRVMVDAPLAAVMEGAESFDVLPGDQVFVYAVNDELRRSVEIQGAVWYPGRYEFRSGMTVASLIERAGGVHPDAAVDGVRIERLIPDQNIRHMVVNPTTRSEVKDQDVVILHSRRLLAPVDSISVLGWVERPGKYPYVSGMLAEDAVIAAGGFRKEADVHLLEVLLDDLGDAGLRSPVLVSMSGRLGALGQLPDSDVPAAAVPQSTVPLTPQASVHVRRAEQVDLGYVSVSGEVEIPGPYALLTQGERFSSILSRSGGLTTYADTNSVQLIREGINVGVDFVRAARGGLMDDPIMVAGDTIRVESLDQTVFVTGAVNFPNRVVYRDGMGVEAMLSEAGGPTARADLNRISVLYADGSRRTVTKVFGLFRNYPSVQPGSEIFVPLQEANSGTDWASVLNMSLTATSTVTTLFLLIREIRNN